jgi:cellobiose phosphorylase
MAFASLGETERAWELARMINPVMHGRSAEGVAVYKVEPYVVTADVYAVPPHVGRGGWSWYTGSSGWMYRLILESLLGLTRSATHLKLEPRMPQDWNTFSLSYRYGGTIYEIRVTKGPTSAPIMTVDGVPQPDRLIALRDSGGSHRVELLVPASDAQAGAGAE